MVLKSILHIYNIVRILHILIITVDSFLIPIFVYFFSTFSFSQQNNSIIKLMKRPTADVYGVSGLQETLAFILSNSLKVKNLDNQCGERKLRQVYFQL